MANTNLAVEKANGVALITLNHPPVNAISRAMLVELALEFDAVEVDDAVRVVVITGAGDKTFSAGADFREFAVEDVRDFQQRGAVLFDRIEHFRKPVIAALNCGAYGGGLELALCCHLRFMADTAEFAFTEVTLGIMPGWGDTQRLPRLVGRARALEYLLTGERVNAQDALICGLVNRVYKRSELLGETRTFAEKLAKGAPLAMAAILDAVVRGSDTTLAEGSRIESEYALSLGETEDALIGVTSFLQNQEPQFKGR